MSFLLISVVNRLGCESANVDNILTYKKIFVLALRTVRTSSTNPHDETVPRQLAHSAAAVSDHGVNSLKINRLIS
jgi:hypothetical protein